MTKNDIYKNNLINFFKSDWLFNGGTELSQPGLAFRSQWGSLRYAANAAYLALLSAKENINSESYKTFAKSQVDYFLGISSHNNQFSYVVGFGSSYPKQPHHKAA